MWFIDRSSAVIPAELASIAGFVVCYLRHGTGVMILSFFLFFCFFFLLAQSARLSVVINIG